MNAAGDTLRSLAESHGLSEVIKYLDDHSADLAGESVVMFVYFFTTPSMSLDSGVSAHKI